MATRGLEKLKRVIWRLQETPKEFYLKKEVELAIMHEIGTNHLTIKSNFEALRKLNWIRGKSKRWYINKKDFY